MIVHPPRRRPTPKPPPYRPDPSDLDPYRLHHVTVWHVYAVTGRVPLTDQPDTYLLTKDEAMILYAFPSDRNCARLARVLDKWTIPYVLDPAAGTATVPDDDLPLLIHAHPAVAAVDQ